MSIISLKGLTEWTYLRSDKICVVKNETIEKCVVYTNVFYLFHSLTRLMTIQNEPKYVIPTPRAHLNIARLSSFRARLNIVRKHYMTKMKKLLIRNPYSLTVQ